MVSRRADYITFCFYRPVTFCLLERTSVFYQSQLYCSFNNRQRRRNRLPLLSLKWRWSVIIVVRISDGCACLGDLLYNFPGNFISEIWNTPYCSWSLLHKNVQTLVVVIFCSAELGRFYPRACLRISSALKLSALPQPGCFGKLLTTDLFVFILWVFKMLVTFLHREKPFIHYACFICFLMWKQGSVQPLFWQHSP